MYTTTDTLLSVKDLNLSFGQDKILRDINLDIKDIVSSNSVTGQIITFLGRSGSGKTTAMKCIAGLLRPTSGQILIGRGQLPVKPGMVGMVLQNYPLFKHYTVLGNLNLISKDKAKIEEFLLEFDIWDHRNKYVKALSGGQRQRVAIVQQLLCSDSLILLDEPFSGLDPVATEKLCQNIMKVANRKEENTVLISTHILEPSIAISDRVLILGHEYTQPDPDKFLERTKIPGATILYNEDLAAQGLAWQPGIRKDPKFIDFIENIRQTFQTL